MPDIIPNASTAEKAIYLYDLLLFSSKSYSLAELSKILGCPNATLMRLLQAIENRKGTELVRDAEDGVERFSLAAPARRPRIVLSPEDVDAVASCVAGSESLDEAARGRLADALGRIRVLFSGTDGVITSAKEPPAKSWIDYTDRRAEISLVLEAIERKALCAMVYRRGGRPQQRWTMAPVSVFASSDALYVAGWLVPESVADAEVAPEAFLRRGEPMKPCLVCMHRLRDIVALNRRHSLPMSIEEPRLFGVMQGRPFRVRAHFEAHVADYVQDRHYSDDQRFLSYSDGTMDLEFTARDADEVVSWILGFGSSARILEPADLVSRVREELAATLARYGGTVVYV